MKIGLVSCAKSSKDYVCPAIEMYGSSRLFRAAIMYCNAHYDKTFILSTRYGLVELNRIIDPYDDNLAEKSEEQVIAWSNKVFWQLMTKLNNILTTHEFYFHTGRLFRQDLMTYLIPNSHCPIKGMRIGQQLKWYKDHKTETSALMLSKMTMI